MHTESFLRGESCYCLALVCKRWEVLLASPALLHQRKKTTAGQFTVGWGKQGAVSPQGRATVEGGSQGCYFRLCLGHLLFSKNTFLYNLHWKICFVKCNAAPLINIMKLFAANAKNSYLTHLLNAFLEYLLLNNRTIISTFNI